MTTSAMQIRCSRCLGTGFDNNTTPPSSCVSCGGTGYVVKDVIADREDED